MRQRNRRLLAAAVIASGLSWSALPAAAELTLTETGFQVTASDFYLPRPAEASDQVGVERLRSSDPIPADLIGATCSITIGAANGESTHGENYGIVRSNGDEVIAQDTEDQPNVIKTTQSDRLITLGATIDIFNVMVEDAAGEVGTSVDYVVDVNCQPAQ